MTFPESILDRVVEIYRNGAWETVTQYVRQSDPITIVRGAGSERSLTNPVSCALTLDNTDSRWSRRVQSSPWFGTLQANLPLAVSVRLGERFLTMSGTTADYVTTPDSAGTSPTGDLDVRVDVTLRSWRTLAGLAGKYGAAGARSWYFRITGSGKLNLGWSTDGTNDVQAASTIPIPWPQANRATVRATLDVNNGAGGYTVTFYYSTTPGVAGEWRQLGDPVVTSAGTTSVFNSTSATTFGALQAGSSQIVAGRLHAGELRSSIGGTVVATPDLRTQTAGASSFSDGTNTWTIGGAGASISNFRTEFVGELPDFPVKRDTSGRDVYVPTVAAGITRRLGQGTTPVRSTLTRAIPSIGSALRAYWPLEDGESSTSAASGIGGSPMRWVTSSPNFAQYDGFDGSAPIPLLEGSSPRGVCPIYTPNSPANVQVRFLMAIPAAGATNGAIIARVTTGGTAPRWDLVYGTGGSLALNAYDSAGVSKGALGPIAFAVDGLELMVSIELAQNGTAVTAAISTVEPGRTTGSTSSTSITSSTITIARSVQMNVGGLLTDTPVGHVTVESTITSLFALGPPLAGWVGETAGNRIERLCGEAGVTFVPFGDLDDSAVMGPQGRDTLLNLMRECERTDGGVLIEPRDQLGIGYRPLSALYSPGTALTLDGGGGSGGDLLDYDVTDDDQAIRNDITATRSGGSSARVVQETGPLGTDTAGTYDDAVTVNTRTDDVLTDHASWRVHLGTIDEPRFPLVKVELARAALVADQGTTTAVLDADIGDGVTIADPPSPTSLPRTDVREVMVGRTVVLGSNTYTMSAVCQPAAGFDVLTFDYEHPDEESRLSSDGTTVDGVHTAGATTLSVDTPVGPLWGHGDGDFTIAIAETGEHMTVTGVTDTGTTTQDLDVVRGVDGTTAVALTGGETVGLARPVYWGLG